MDNFGTKKQVVGRQMHVKWLSDVNIIKHNTFKQKAQVVTYYHKISIHYFFGQTSNPDFFIEVYAESRPFLDKMHTMSIVYISILMM